MKPHISTILKKGAKLKARKLTKKDLELIEKTVKEQEKIPKSFRFPYAQVRWGAITANVFGLGGCAL